MKVREYRPADEAPLRDAYLARGFEGGWRPMQGAVAAYVVVDEHDVPVVMAAAHPAVEVRVVIDQSFATPGLRNEAFLLVHDALNRELRRQGFPRALALLEGAVGRGFGKRLARLRGWMQARGIVYEREV